MSPNRADSTLKLHRPGWAYNVTAEIINAPASVNVLDGTAGFSHPDARRPVWRAHVARPLAGLRGADIHA
jgi:hypothetical protein